MALGAACLAAAGCSSSNEKKAEATVPGRTGPAPDVFTVNFDTSKGPILVEVHREWAPYGVDHLYDLVKSGFYDGNRFFRFHRDFIVQFGINGDPSTNMIWANARITDDPVKQHNIRGTLTYAAAAMPNSRSTQLFFNLADNSSKLDGQGFAPLGKVTSGMDVIDSLYSAYGEVPMMGGQGPDPNLIMQQGNKYLEDQFPRLDYIKKASIQ
jgi:peptidyl-prolyl cis-trans isomerase A (cyclophilin A)